MANIVKIKNVVDITRKDRIMTSINGNCGVQGSSNAGGNNGAITRKVVIRKHIGL